MNYSMEELRSFAVQVQLMELRPTQMSAELLADLPPRIRPKPTIELEVEKSEDRFFVFGRFALEGGKDGGDEAVFRFTYNAVAGYRVREGTSMPSERLLREFAETSSMVHLWPYFRSYVQTSAALLQFPVPLVVPTFIPGTLRRETEAANDNTSRK